MCRISLIFLFIICAEGHAAERASRSVEATRSDSVDTFTDTLVDELFGRTSTASASQHTDLDATALGKPSKPSRTSELVKEEYDYIVVGAGAAGSLVARRLSDAGKKVLVLERGTGYGGLLKTIPASVVKLFLNPTYDYMLESEGEKHIGNRGVYLIRGRMVGGSSGCNVLLYLRGTARDYDKYWPEGWKSKDNLAYFKKFERYASKIVGRDCKNHGYDGQLTVEDVNYQNKLSDAWMDSNAEVGATRKKDFNDWDGDQAGVGKFQVTTKNGRRQDGYAAFLKGARRATILTGMQVIEIKLTSERVATGVEFADVHNNRYTAKVKPGGEVLLAAGAVMSPEILMQSGIGPAKELAKVGITTRIDLPGVGKNLQDQPGVSVQYNVRKNISITNDMFIKGTAKVKPLNLLKWLLRGSGPLTSPGCEQGSFYRTKEGLDDPDLQIRLVPARGTDSDAVKTYANLGRIPPAPSGIAMQVIAVRPESTGTIKLRDGSASSKPLINLNYLEAPRDRQTLKDGIRLARKIAAQNSLKDHVLSEEWPGDKVQTDAQIDRYISETVHSTNAVVGTCKMGTSTDKFAVVDTSLRVIGAKQLRVVDASVFPKVPGGQTAAPTYMVAERGAEMILSERACCR